MQTVTTEEQTNISAETVNWPLMGSLTALYASIVIGWIAYSQYQPKLLSQFNFNQFAILLMICQAVILTITPPVAGLLGDRFRQTQGHRFPVISLGISFAAMIFMAVAFTLLSEPGEIFRWILPVLIILWLIAMSIFTSPALSTIETFIPVEKLPRAMAILTITANLLYSLEPVIVEIIDYLGAAVTFIAGGAFVFGTGFILKRNAFSLLAKNNGFEPVVQEDDGSNSSYGFIFLIGSILGIVTALLFHLFPDVLSVSLSDLLNDTNSKVLIVGILIISGVLALPFSNIVIGYGLTRSFLISAVASGISICSILLLDSPLATLLMLVLFSISFASLSVSALPLAMERAKFSEKVFCVGIFFSGVALPDGIFEVFELL